MKALSLRQPWAELVIRGEKTMDVRTWQATYRGPLAIHASKTRRAQRIRQVGLEPDALIFGAPIGFVELTDIIPLDEAAYEALRPQHLSDKPFPGSPLYGWRFERPRRLPQPIPFRGRMSLFEMEDALLSGPAAEAKPPSRKPLAIPALPSDSQHPFVLYALPQGNDVYRVALYQWLPRKNGSDAGVEERRPQNNFWKIEEAGDVLRATADPLIRTLQLNGYRAADLSRRLESTFFLDEPSGLRLALIFLAVKPISRHDRIEAIVNGIQAMSDEEAYYWFSKCSRGPIAQRAQRALRVLLAAE